MTETTTLERLLLDDLDVEAERAADEKFCTELYRALTRNVWRNASDRGGGVGGGSRGGAEPELPARGVARQRMAGAARQGAPAARADRRRGRGRPDGRGCPRRARLDAPPASDRSRPPEPPRP